MIQEPKTDPEIPRGATSDIAPPPAPPLYLDWLDVRIAPAFAAMPGRLGLTILPGRKCPGRREVYHRDLAADAATLAHLGVDAYVLLVEDADLIACGVPDFVPVLRRQGIPVLRCPIVDHRTPADTSPRPRPLSAPPEADHVVPAPGDLQAFAATLRAVEVRLRAGQTIAASCRGGLGRAGTFAACLLVNGGLPPGEAIAGVRAARPGAIEPGDQEAFVLAWVPAGLSAAPGPDARLDRAFPGFPGA